MKGAGGSGKAMRPRPELDLIDGGEMGELVRAMDWSKTPVGPAENWPQSLRTAVRIMLSSRYPMFVWWGPELTNFYNDAYIPILGKRHPSALGRSAPEVWSEIWDQVGPQAEFVLTEGRATWDEELLLIMERNQFLEETYFTYSYSPVFDDRGEIGGLFCACTEDTRRVLGQRRLRTLRSLAERAGLAKTAEEACEAAVHTLKSNSLDLPFTLVYLLADGGVARLAGVGGLESDSPAAPAVIHVADDDASWPLHEVVESGRRVDVHDLSDRFGPLPGGAWAAPPQQAVVLPMTERGLDRITGFLIAGVSPRLAFDDEYQGFMNLLSEHVTAAVATARAYEEERRRADALAEIDRAKTTFFSNVSHELRTPLTLILGPVEELLTRGDEWPDDVSAELEVVYRNGLRLRKLVDSLLDFSRIEAGRIQASYEPTDLGPVTADLASNFRSACLKGGIDLVVDCLPLPEPVYVDRDMWERIVLNLLSNAFKFTLEGRIEISLRAHRIEDGAVLRVADTGVGIPAEELPRLFERFHRVEGNRGRTSEGTGIGLALVQELTRLHGGSIDVESELGQGATFTLRLPFGNAHLPTQQVDASRVRDVTATGAAPYVEEALRWLPDEPATGDLSWLSSVEPTPGLGVGSAANQRSEGRVLLADDNADMREYLSRLLTPRFEVVTTSDGRRALELLKVVLPDLILSDVMMPGLDGFELLSTVRADSQTRSIPVILLSARAGEEARIEGLDAGADDYLTKPFSARELVARVETHIKMGRIRRESETRFRDLADTAPTVLWVTDEENACTFLSRGWYEYTGQAPDEGLGFGWLDAVHPEDRESARKIFFEAARCREAFRFDCRLRTAEGAYRWALDAAKPRFDDTGEFLGYIGSVIDVHERKQAEEALREADRRKDEFLATLAHELRNPLAPVQNAVGILDLKGSEDPQLSWARGVIDRQVGHMSRLLDDLLDVNRIRRGHWELRKGRVELSRVVRHAVETSQPMIDSAGHELTVSLPSDTVWLEADLTRLAQALSNLLNNAAKYTPPEGRIWLTAERRGEEVVLSVRDNGIGIPEEELSRIFGLFEQVDPVQEKPTGGLGIGLTLVRRLVEMHGGTVEARSPGPKEGTEFVLRLPGCVREGGESAPKESGKRVTGVSPQRILVVDDNRDGADSLATVLELHGHETRTAYDGKEAVEKVGLFRPDVVLLDIGLPDMSGYEVCRLIRSRDGGRDVLVLALTGWGQEEDKRRAREVGFDHHLVKPVRSQAVLELLADASSSD